MQNSTYNPTINKINFQLNKLNSIIQNTKSHNSQFLSLLKNCNLSTPSSSSSILFDQLPTRSDAQQIFHQTSSKIVSSIHSNNFSDTFNKNQSSLMSKIIPKDKKQKKSNPFKKYHSGINLQSQKTQSNQRSTLQPSKQTIKKTKIMKSQIGKTKKEIPNKYANINKSKQSDKILILQSQKKIVNNKSQPKYKIQLDLKKQKVSKIRKITRKREKDVSNHGQENFIMPTKTEQSSQTQNLKSKRNNKDKYSSVPLKQKDFKNIITYRNSSNKFHIDLEKQVGEKITDLKLNQKIFQLQKKYFLTSIKVTKKQLQKIENSHNKSLSSNDLLKYILDAVKELISSIISQSSHQNDKQNKRRMYQSLSKPQFFLKTINQFPDTLKNLSFIAQSIYKKFAQNMKQIQEKVTKITYKPLTKTSLFAFYTALHEYLEFLVKNKLIKTSKQNKSIRSKNQHMLSCRNAKNQRQKSRRDMEIKPVGLKKRQASQRKKEQIRTLKRVSTVKILGKNKS